MTLAGEDTVMQASDETLGADPEIAAAVLKENGEPVAANSWRVRLAECREADAVKPHQTIQSCQPEIGITGLKDITNGILRKSVVHCPAAEAVLALRAAGKSDP